VENRGQVSRLAAAVDASLATVRLAAEAGADLLLAHHGLFWNTRLPWTGSNYRLLQTLIEKDVAVYSAHLPLDAHPEARQQRVALPGAGPARPRTVLRMQRTAHWLAGATSHRTR
jgi:putative NIF3 family GTP cyclohydrolase 1 type 2